MAIDPQTAINAYQSTLRELGHAGGAGDKTVAPTEDSGFAAMLGDALNGAVDAGHNAEQMSIKAVTGEADLADVVTAVTNAEIQLQTIVTVRDKVLQAYQDVMRMPI